jgi:hypothetical protein
MVDFLIYPIHLLTAHPFVYMVVFMLAIFVFGASRGDKTKKGHRWLFILGFLSVFLNFFGGHYLNSILIYRFGEQGIARITGSYATSTQYNEHDVVGYHVLVKTPEGKTVETGFEDDDFNVYPSHNRVSYPSVGDNFNVRYLRHFPGAFVMITNDDSAWAVNLRCTQLNNALYEASQKYNFDRNKQEYRDGYIMAIQAVIDNRCYTDSTDLEKYHNDIGYIRQGKQF